jgi:hypothetical protein
MRTDLTTLFTEKLVDPSTVVSQYLVFHLSSGDLYLSDHELEYAPGLYCSPIVESWGTLSEAQDTERAASGAGLPTRQHDLSIFNTEDTGWFAGLFNTTYPENIEVDLYQVLSGVPQHLLLGRMLMRGPFSDSEASITFKFSLVSLNQLNDPYIGTIDPVTKNFSPVIIGSQLGVVGTLFGVNPLVQLSVEVLVTDTSIVADQDIVAAGFPTSGTIEIDYDVITYTGVSGSTFTGVSGITNTHSVSQYVTKSGHDYVFAFGTGPVDQAGPVYVNDLIYTGPHVIDKDSNPVTVTFTGGLPFIDDSQYDSFVEDLSHSVTSGADWSDKNGEETQGPGPNGTGFVHVKTDTSGFPLNTVFGGFNDFPALPAGAIIDYGYIRVHTHLYKKSSNVNHYSGWGGAHLILLGQDQGFKVPDPATTSFEVYDVTVYSNTAADYEPSQTLLDFTAYGLVLKPGGDPWVHVVSTWNVDRYVEYRTIKDGYPKKTNYLNPTLDLVAAGGGAANPSSTVAQILTTKGEAAYINAASFATASSWFDTNGYSFDGLIPGDYRCSQALVDVLEQCRGYLVYNGGEIFLRVRQSLDTLPTSYTSTLSNRQAYSISTSRQPVADVTNSLNMRYAPNALQDEWQGLYLSQDISSIASTIGLQEDTLDAYLIQNQAMAEDLADFIVGEKAVPKQVITFTGYLDALPLERGDAVFLQTAYKGITYADGIVENITRTFGSVKSGIINTIQIAIAAVIRLIAGTEEIAESIPAPTEVVTVGEKNTVSEAIAIDSETVASGVGWSEAPWNGAWPG